MLPFTKRPAKGEESDVVVKDELAAPKSPSVPPPASSSRPTSLRPHQMRSSDEDEMTGIVSSKAFQSQPAPLPAAGLPATVPPSSRRPPPMSGPATIPPPARSVRPITLRPPPASVPPPAYEANSYEASSGYDGGNYDEEDAEDEDGGRTVVRPDGSAKIVRRPNIEKASPSNNPTSISPAAVIRATMESARAARQAQGLAAAPSDYEDNDEYTQAAPSRGRSVSPRSFEGPPSHPPPRSGDYDNDYHRDHRGHEARSQDDAPRSYAAPAHSGPVSTSPRPNHFQQHAAPPSHPSPPASNPYNHAPNASQPPQMGQPTAAMPAHFRMAQTGAAVGMNGAPAPVHHPGMPFDPPGTAVTSNNPRLSGRPAMSWAAALAACGIFIGVVAVAIAQRGDAMSDAQASFVDPAHTAKTPATQPAATDPAPQPLPPGLIGASPVQPAAPAAAPTVPGMADPNLGLAPPAATAPAAPAASAPAAVASAKPATTAKKWAAAAPAPARKATTTAASTAGDDDDEAPKKSAKAASAKKGGDGADDETKKALEALQKAQLESATSFGGK